LGEFLGLQLRLFALLQLDLYDPSSFHIDNSKPIAVVLDSFPSPGDALQLGQKKARQGVIIGRFLEGQIVIGL
jgi:hypothetical protein